MSITVRDLVSRQPSSLSAEASVAEALDLVLQFGIEEFYVTDDQQRLVGVVTDYELLKAQLTRSVGSGCVEDVMSRSPGYVGIDEPLAAVMMKFREARYARMAVVEEGRLVGSIARRDVMRMIHSLEVLGLEQMVEQTSAVDPANAMRGPRYLQNRKLMAEHSLNAVSEA